MHKTIIPKEEIVAALQKRVLEAVASIPPGSWDYNQTHRYGLSGLFLRTVIMRVGTVDGWGDKAEVDIYVNRIGQIFLGRKTPKGVYRTSPQPLKGLKRAQLEKLGAIFP